MARRRKNGGIETLLTYPWWLSAVFCICIFSTFRWLVPAILGQNPILKGIAFAVQPLSWILAVPFAFASFIALLGQFGKPRSEVKSSIQSRLHGKESELDRFFSESARSSKKATPDVPEKPTEWSLEVLRSIEWKRFEELCAEIYKLRGFRTEMQFCGADGGIDIRLFDDRSPSPIAIVQCKAWNTSQVGVRLIRELLGIMVHNKIERGIFITTNDYTQEAINFASQNPITLISGATMIEDISHMPVDARKKLLQFATEGDYTTPTCPSCGIKMVRRSGPRGEFWGCKNYPGCKYVAKI